MTLLWALIHAHVGFCWNKSQWELDRELKFQIARNKLDEVADLKFVFWLKGKERKVKIV